MAVAIAAPSGASPDSDAAQRGCVKKNSIAAIIDDSQSMSGSDSNRLRVQGLNLFMTAPGTGNENKTLSAIEFGSDAGPLFAPGQIGPNLGNFTNILNTGIKADNGGTNYNAAFTLVGTHHANADARIFLTDGGHNSGDYAENHKPGPPTYVVGLGITGSGEDVDRLRRIANETGGFTREVSDVSDLQSAFVDINTAVNCQRPPIRFVDNFSRVGQKIRHSVNVGGSSRSANLTATWSNPNDQFDIIAFRETVGKQVIGKISQRRRKRSVRRFKVTTRRGATFVSLKLAKLKPSNRAKLRFQIRAKKLSTPGAKVITQVSRSRSR